MAHKSIDLCIELVYGIITTCLSQFTVLLYFNSFLMFFFYCFRMLRQSFLSKVNLIFRSLKLNVSLDLSIYSVHE